jgi:hypothetical protein
MINTTSEYCEEIDCEMQYLDFVIVLRREILDFRRGYGMPIRTNLWDLIFFAQYAGR